MKEEDIEVLAIEYATNGNWKMFEESDFSKRKEAYIEGYKAASKEEAEDESVSDLKMRLNSVRAYIEEQKQMLSALSNSLELANELLKSNSKEEVSWDEAIKKIEQPLIKILANEHHGYSICDILEGLKENYTLIPKK